MPSLVVAATTMSRKKLAKHLMARHGHEFVGTGIENAIWISEENYALFLFAHIYWHKHHDQEHIHEEA